MSKVTTWRQGVSKIHLEYYIKIVVHSSADPEGGGDRGSIGVSIGNKQLDPPLEKVGPPGKCWTPSGTLKNDRFLRN